MAPVVTYSGSNDLPFNVDLVTPYKITGNTPNSAKVVLQNSQGDYLSNIRVLVTVPDYLDIIDYQKAPENGARWGDGSPFPAEGCLQGLDTKTVSIYCTLPNSEDNVITLPFSLVRFTKGTGTVEQNNSCTDSTFRVSYTVYATSEKVGRMQTFESSDKKLECPPPAQEDIEVTMSGPSTVTRGSSTVDYVIHVANHGYKVYPSVQIQSLLPGDLVYLKNDKLCRITKDMMICRVDSFGPLAVKDFKISFNFPEMKFACTQSVEIKTSATMTEPTKDTLLSNNATGEIKTTVLCPASSSIQSTSSKSSAASVRTSASSKKSSVGKTSTSRSSVAAACNTLARKDRAACEAKVKKACASKPAKEKAACLSKGLTGK